MANKAMTMLELILVVVIMAIATAIIAPGLINLISNYDLSIEVKKMRSKIRYAQQLAIAIQKTYRISFDTDNARYTIYEIDSYDPDEIDWIDLKNNIGIEQINFTPDTIDFDHFGAPEVDVLDEGATKPEITLREPKGNSQTISIAPATGKVKIE